MNAKTYSIREVFDTIQGEGSRVGHRSVFVRFAGCNLWDGIPAHRDQGRGVCAQWCDTDFARGEPLTAQQLLKRMDAAWPYGHGQHSRRWCVLTGGEPSLQFDKALIDALHKEGWKVTVETNGTNLNLAFADVDFVTLSPKLGAKLQLTECDELKVILPGAVGPCSGCHGSGWPGPRGEGSPCSSCKGTGRTAGWTDDQLKEVALGMHSAKLYVQPQDPVDPLLVGVSQLHDHVRTVDRSHEWASNLKRCIDFVRANPDWALSMQVHKWAGLP